MPCNEGFPHLAYFFRIHFPCFGFAILAVKSFISPLSGDSHRGIVTILSHQRHQRSTPQPEYPLSVLLHSCPVAFPHSHVLRRCTHLVRFVQRGQQYQSCGYSLFAAVWFLGWHRAAQRRKRRGTFVSISSFMVRRPYYIFATRQQENEKPRHLSMPGFLA